MVQMDYSLRRPWEPWKPWQSRFVDTKEKQETILKWIHTTIIIRYSVYFKPTEIGFVVTWNLVGMGIF